MQHLRSKGDAHNYCVSWTLKKNTREGPITWKIKQTAVALGNSAQIKQYTPKQTNTNN